AGPFAPDGDCDRAYDVHLHLPGWRQGLPCRRPVHGCRGESVNAILADILNDADNLLPRRDPNRACTLTDSLPQRGRRRAPKLASQILRNDHDRAAALQVGPGEIAAGNQSRADGLKETWRDGLE